MPLVRAASIPGFCTHARPMASSLLVLLDDIATVLDDVATMTKVAAKKTAGVLGDDLALNAQQVTGVKADRELPVVWAVAWGSLINKAILVPAALAISAFAPWAITPLLMLGGAFLCFEGFEKLAHKFLHSPEEDEAHRAEHVKAVADEKVDMAAYERDKVKGAIRTDFILSAEIIVISLGTVASVPLQQQLAVLIAVSIAMTVGIFTAAALLLVLGTAALMQLVGLSMALGAFLAGVLLAESEYRRELETDLEPFKGLLLGLFFIAVGMGLDLKAVAAQPVFVLGVLATLLVCKTVVLVAMARAMQIPLVERPAFVILLAQGGEFGFVVFQLAQSEGMITAGQNSALVAAVALSLALTPLLLTGGDRLMSQKLARLGQKHKRDEAPPPPAPILIAGSGRYGQVVGRMLRASGLEATLLDQDAEAIEGLRRFGWTVHYGDATRLDLLKSAGAATARILVIAVDDIGQSLEIAELAREHFPQLTVVARARNVQHYYQLREAGVRHIERETFDSALMSARSVLELTGMEPHAARRQAMHFRRHNIEVLERMLPLQSDEGALIAAAKLGRQQFEQQMAAERDAEEAHRRAQRGGWDKHDD